MSRVFPSISKWQCLSCAFHEGPKSPDTQTANPLLGTSHPPAQYTGKTMGHPDLLTLLRRDTSPIQGMHTFHRVVVNKAIPGRMNLQDWTMLLRTQAEKHHSRPRTCQRKMCVVLRDQSGHYGRTAQTKLTLLSGLVGQESMLLLATAAQPQGGYQKELKFK